MSINEKETLELPDGWTKVRLGDIRHDNSTGILPSREPNELFELYSVPSHQTGKPEVLTGKEKSGQINRLSLLEVFLSRKLILGLIESGS